MTTVLICSPSTREPEVRSVLGGFVKEVRRVAPGWRVCDLPIDHLSDRGEGTRIAIPLSLTGHDEVVRALSDLREPGLLVAPALGPDWLLAELAVRRLVDAGAHQGDTIVMGVAGSDDPDVIEDYSRAARLLSAVWGGPVHLGSVRGRDTSLADAIDIARAYGRRIVVASYLLTPGTAADRLRASGADVVTAPILDGASVDRRLLRLVLDRCSQALGGSIPGNAQVVL